MKPVPEAEVCAICGGEVGYVDKSVYTPYPSHNDKGICNRLIRADERDQCAYRALEARDRTRRDSDAWARLDRLAYSLFESARTLRGGRSND